MHDNTKAELQAILLERDINLNDAKNAAASAHNQTFLKDDATPVCTRKCLEAQIDRHMKDVGTGGRISIRQKDGATRKNYEKRRIGKV